MTALLSDDVSSISILLVKVFVPIVSQGEQVLILQGPIKVEAFIVV